MNVLILWILAIGSLRSLTLQEAILKSDLSSYDLKIKEQEIKIKEGEAIQASLLPNPALDVAVDSFGGNGPYNGVNQAVAAYEIQTLWELGGKRYERTQAASLDKILAEWNLEEVKVELLTHLKLAFIDAFIAQEKLLIEKHYLECAKKAFDAVDQFTSLGKEAKVNYSKAKITYLHASMEMEKHERDFLLKKNILSSYWGESCPDFDLIEFDLFSMPCILNRCSYESRLTTYPGLIRQRLMVDRALREVELQRSHAWPDLLLSLGVDHVMHQGNVGMRFGVNIPLPFFNSNQGKIFSAKHQVIQADLEAKEYYIELLLQVRKIYQELESAAAEAELYQTEILPALQIVYEGAKDSYEQGKMDMIQYLENEKFFIETQISYLNSIAAVHKFYIEISQYIRAIP